MLHGLRGAVLRAAGLGVLRVLAGDDCYTLSDVAGRAGLDAEVLRRDLVNLGMAVPDDEIPAFDDDDLEAARAIAAFRGAGLDEEGLQSVGRVLGQTMRTLTAAIRELLVESVQPADGERDFGLRYAELAGALGRELEIVVAHATRVHMREGIRYQIVGGVERETGQLPDTVRMTVAFADLAGFTVLAQALVEDEIDMPALHGGVATGDVVLRRGELYGSTPNLASRLCSLAEPGCVLADAPTRAARGEAPWEPSGAARPKGFDREMELFALST